MRSWELAVLICSIRNVTTSCLHLPGWQRGATHSPTRLRGLANAERQQPKAASFGKTGLAPSGFLCLVMTVWSCDDWGHGSLFISQLAQ